nr:CPBP family intramembrane glutamic endopeptidase [Thalassobacillus sp. CUG 92003]
MTYALCQISTLAGVPILYYLVGLSRNNSIAIWSIISFSIATLIILRLLKPDMTNLSHERSGKGGIILWSILGVFMALFSQGIAVQIESLFGISQGSENTRDIIEVAQQSPLFILLPVVFAPITEEIIFRKIIFGSIYKRTNFIVAVLISSIIFGAFHFDFSHILIYTAMGMVFAFLYVKTKSIITPIVAHMAMNSLVVVAQYGISEEEYEDIMEQLQMILIGGF